MHYLREPVWTKKESPDDLVSFQIFKYGRLSAHDSLLRKWPCEEFWVQYEIIFQNFWMIFTVWNNFKYELHEKFFRKVSSFTLGSFRFRIALSNMIPGIHSGISCLTVPWHTDSLKDFKKFFLIIFKETCTEWRTQCIKCSGSNLPMFFEFSSLK